jgi:hypothetical protein
VPSLETVVRFLFAAITLAAASLGFTYLEQQSAASRQSLRTASRPLFDWSLPIAEQGAHDSEPSDQLTEHVDSVKDAFQRIQSESRSVLNEFVREQGLTEAAFDDVLVQVRDLAKSPLSSTSRRSGPSIHDESRVQHRPADANDPANEETSAAIASSIDELARSVPLINDDDIEAQVDSVRNHASTPGASVQEATLVRSRKPTSVSQAPAPVQTMASPRETMENVGSTNQVAQVGGREENAGATRAKSVSKNAASVPEWKVVGKTTENKPLHTRRFGDSGSRALIVAGLDGEDRIAVRWIDQLSEELVQHPELYSACEVMIFRAGNPDGLTNNVSANARGVLINRNFPSRRYRPLPDMSSGAGPATEAETRALLDVLYSFHPRRVIHLSATSARSKALYNRGARQAANELQSEHGVDVHPIDIEQYPGSLEDFADGTLEAGVLLMQLNVGKDWQQAWTKHQPTILAAVTGRSFDKFDPNSPPLDDLTRSAPDLAATGSRIPVSSTEPTRKKRGRGYEELPPPPQ